MKNLIRPKQVRVGTQRKITATSYAHHPPTKTKALWTWRMIFVDETSGKRIRINVGRLCREDVAPLMRVKLQALNHTAGIAVAGITTVGELLRTWYHYAIVNRGPTSRLRKEYRLSKYTLKNYQTSMNTIIKVVGTARLSSLNSNSITRIRHSLQERYAPRTIHQCLSRFKQALTWGRKNGVPIPEVEMELRRPANGKGYINNRRTPTQEEVEELCQSIPSPDLRLAIFIGWKTGGRTGEVTELEWGDFIENDTGCWVRLNGKTGERLCPFSKSDFDEIIHQRADKKSTEKVFSKSLRINVSTQLRAACRRYAIPEFTFYGLRRLRVDTLQRQGIEPAVYEQIMGHSVRMAKDIYRTPDANDLQGVIKEQSPPPTKASEGDIIHLLIEKLGLSMEEALRRLIGD
jgi:integrase